MKFSYNWIRELIPGLDTDPQELMRLITMKTAECEGLEEIGAATPSLRWTTSRSRIGLICGAITEWRARWRRSPGLFPHPRKLRDPVKPGVLPSGEAPVEIAIEDFALCPRYSALVFENVTVGRHPCGCSIAWKRLG